MYRGDHKKGEIEIEYENIVFENSYATLYNDTVIFPSGNKGAYLRFCWNAPYGVMIFARDKNQRLLLVRNFRHENRRWSWEIPKGFGEPELTPLACAQKELLEETGYEGENWQLLKTIDEKGSPTYLFTTELKSKKMESSQEISEAISEVKLFTRKEAKSLLFQDDVTDPMTMFYISLSQVTEE